MSTREVPAVDPSPRPKPTPTADEGQLEAAPPTSAPRRPPTRDPDANGSAEPRRRFRRASGSGEAESDFEPEPEPSEALAAPEASVAAAPPAATLAPATSPTAAVPATAPPPAAAVGDPPAKGTRHGVLTRVVLYDDQVTTARGDQPPPVQIRRVRRVVRRVDSWSVFRFSLMLYLCALAIGMAAAVGMWIVASISGAIPSIENFITQLFALKKFTFEPLQMFLGTLGIGIVCVFVATLMTVLTGVLFNLISDVVGGVEITVLEEEPLEVVG